MWWRISKSSILLASCILIFIITTQATPTRHTINTASSPPTSSISTTSAPSNQPPTKRAPLTTHHLPNNFLVHYVPFSPFTHGPLPFTTLAYFWQYLAHIALSTPTQNFNKANILFRWGQLRMEMFNVAGSAVSRDFVLQVADVMAAYVARGFCGLFNARVRTPGGVVVWVTMTVDGK
jgi:hypothetical protein